MRRLIPAAGQLYPSDGFALTQHQSGASAPNCSSQSVPLVYKHYTTCKFKLLQMHWKWVVNERERYASSNTSSRATLPLWRLRFDATPKWCFSTELQFPVCTFGLQALYNLQIQIAPNALDMSSEWERYASSNTSSRATLPLWRLRFDATPKWCFSTELQFPVCTFGLQALYNLQSICFKCTGNDVAK